MASAEGSKNCDHLVFEAVNESSVSKLKLVISSYSEMEVLTGLVQCNEKGETSLEIAMKMENVPLINEMVKFLRLCDREVAKCEVMSEAIDKLFYRQLPILDLIDYLINLKNNQTIIFSFSMLNNPEWLDMLGQVVFKSTFLSRPDKIIALEFIGASLLCSHYKENSKFFAMMFWCWRDAMKLRYFPADGEPILPKIPYVGVSSVASSVVLGSAEEVMTMEELNLLREDFVRNVFHAHGFEEVLECITPLQRQSLLVIRRISSQANHGLPHWLYLQSLYELGSGEIQDVDDDGHLILYVEHDADNQLIINTFLLILEQITTLDPKLLPRPSFNIFIQTLCLASHYLALMARKPPGYPGREELISYTNLLALTRFISTIAKYFPNPAMISTIKFSYRRFSDLAEIMYDLVYVLESMSPQLSSQEKQQLEDYLSNYTRNYFLERTNSVLHAGVRCLLKRKFRSSANLKPIQLMIKLGADPNAIDEDGNTPLHTLAGIEGSYLDEKLLKLLALQVLREPLGMAADNGDSDEYLPIFRALVDAGTHLDTAADNGNTVLDILKRNGTMHQNRDVAANTYFSTLINKVFPLSCYCARVIRQNGIRFDEDRLPLHLQEFVSRHSANGSVNLRQRRDN